MKVVEMRKLNTADLMKNSTTLREEIAELRRRMHSGETHNVRILRAKRKELARVLTVMGEQFTKEMSNG